MSNILVNATRRNIGEIRLELTARPSREDTRLFDSACIGVMCVPSYIPDRHSSVLHDHRLCGMQPLRTKVCYAYLFRVSMGHRWNETCHFYGLPRW